MRFNVALTLSLLSAFFIGCSYESDPSGEYIIGKAVDDIGGLSSQRETSSQYVVLYDPTVKRIQKFDLQSLEHLASLETESTGGTHNVLAASDGRFIVDFADKQVFLYNREGELRKNPVKILGTPVSVAFHPDQPYLIIYDDLMSISVLRLNENGDIDGFPFVSGPVFDDGAQIISGEIAEDGRLLFSLTSGEIAIVDLEETLATKEWQAERVMTSLDDMKWIAPVPNQTDRALVRSSNKLSLVNLIDGSVVDEKEISKYADVQYSKSGDPHVIASQTNNFDVDKKTLYVVSDGEIVERQLFERTLRISHSFIDVASNEWTFITNDDGRSLIKKALSSLSNHEVIPLPKKGELRLSHDYVFALMPSELGWARRYSTTGDDLREVKLFNLKFMK